MAATSTQLTKTKSLTHLWGVTWWQAAVRREPRDTAAMRARRARSAFKSATPTTCCSRCSVKVTDVTCGLPEVHKSAVPTTLMAHVYVHTTASVLHKRDGRPEQHD
eukprot:366015-Chlamydomonas_euryale.AAC.5